ncbi:class I SAM-dependent methyltransferase [Aliikangiella sp. IMCC44359]|uniref:class I SAM-dependent methyltransferase n=1 Tax=Aliikangiella sp. IMCC44359 TaxID=3459125 RepID=UPI00403ADC03
MNSTLSIKNSVNQLTNKQKSLNNSFLSYWLKKIIIKRLKTLQLGQLTLVDGNNQYHFKGKEMLDVTAEVHVLNEQFYQFVAFGGSLGAGESYINEYWQTPDLTKVIQLFALNQSVLSEMDSGLAKLTSPLKRFFHWLNKNTHHGSRKNIVAHYDLGNDFFKQFLDPTMMYSSGIFYSEEDSMEQASNNKLKRICEQLRLSEKDHVVEIGTGWGSFAIYAAENYGCHITTTTISDEQYEYAKERIKTKGLNKKITLLKQDYRNLEGQYDKLVSIEMIEAVGHHYFDTFFKKCSQLLKPNGEILLQAITIIDQKFEQSKKEVDYIKRYIFPGSCIPSVDAISSSIKSSTDMRIQNLYDIGMDYALTLKAWREAFFNNIETIKSLGYSDAFIRMWEFYLCYCEGGFRERVISNVQLHIVKPHARVPLASTQVRN